jgi:hypothetical protein
VSAPLLNYGKNQTKTESRAGARPSRCIAEIGKDLELAVGQFQAEPDRKKAHEQWKEIETSIFGVRFED